MRHYTKILIWENNKRLDKLLEFRELVVEYFNNSRSAEWGSSDRIEEDTAREARLKINLVRNEVRSIILSSGASFTYEYTPPPVVGGSKHYIDVITNMFYLDQIDVHPGVVIDYIEMVIGIYESNQKSACWRIINPFFYLGWLFDIISDLPFIVVEKFGFNQQKAKASAIGRLFKGVFYLIPIVAATIVILKAFEGFEPVKQFVHELLDYEKAN